MSSIDFSQFLLPDKLRDEFPILSQLVRGQPLVYLDNAATTQKPQVVIDAITSHYREANANVHRGLYYLSERATSAYEEARQVIANYLNCSSNKEIIFTRSATEGINLLANCLTQKLSKGDRILLTEMEHHSNLVPWQLAAQQKQLILDFVPVLPEQGTLDLDAFEKLLSREPKIFSVTHISNGLGTVNPIEKLVSRARSLGIT
ncbi:MAG: aminotransferase class V-fold PLP-dependent enzyme, partial [Chthoniobacterales bacterium]|nr:aminotransferase class V-fold PLP-dependent enzyme [Chthoniobacterales bacterium]